MRQLAYLSDATYPSEDLYPGQVVERFAEAWRDIADNWPSHEGKPPQSADRMHVETHILEGRDVFVTDDKPLLAMCKKLDALHEYSIVAVGLREFFDVRAQM